MKITLVMGRGIEGTGNTRITIEFYEYLKSLGNDVEILANSEKNWGRKNSQVHNIIEYNFKKGVNSEYRKDDEYIIIMSVPAKNFTEQGKENFMKFLEDRPNSKIAYLQVDHKLHSVNRNFYSDKQYMERLFVNLSPIVINHNIKNDFAQKFLFRHNLNVNLKSQEMISCNFGSQDYVFDKSNKVDGLCYFIGRSAGWKGWIEFKDLHYNHLMKHGFTSIIEGIELSIGVLGELYKELKPNRIERDDVSLQFNKDPELFLNTKNTPALIFGPYTRLDALKRVSKAKFGMFFTYLGEEFGGVLENTFLEIIASGTVPVIRKELYDTAQFNGKRMNDYHPEELGIVVYDSSNPEECVSLLMKLDKNQMLYGEYLTRSYSFAKDNFNQSYILERVWNLIHEN